MTNLTISTIFENVRYHVGNEYNLLLKTVLCFSDSVSEGKMEVVLFGDAVSGGIYPILSSNNNLDQYRYLSLVSTDIDLLPFSEKVRALNGYDENLFPEMLAACQILHEFGYIHHAVYNSSEFQSLYPHYRNALIHHQNELESVEEGQYQRILELAREYRTFQLESIVDDFFVEFINTNGIDGLLDDREFYLYTMDDRYIITRVDIADNFIDYYGLRSAGIYSSYSDLEYRFESVRDYDSLRKILRIYEFNNDIDIDQLPTLISSNSENNVLMDGADVCLEILFNENS